MALGPAQKPNLDFPVTGKILGRPRQQGRFLPDSAGLPVLRQLLPLSLSYDHRVINGADAARFLCAMAESLESFDFE